MPPPAIFSSLLGLFFLRFLPSEGLHLIPLESSSFVDSRNILFAVGLNRHVLCFGCHFSVQVSASLCGAFVALCSPVLQVLQFLKVLVLL